MQAQRPASVANRRDESRRPSARGGRGAGAGRSPSPAPGQESPPRRRAFWIAVAAALAALNIVLATLVLTGGRDDDDPLADRVAELEAQEEANQTELVGQLTEQATAAHAGLLSVIAGLHAVVPSGSPPVGTVAGVDPASWHSAVGAAIGTFGDAPSGSTEFNTTRNGLLLAIDLLGSAATAYEGAVAAPAGAEQDRLFELAGRLRDQAVAAWSVAATQLDVLNIEAGNGHVHITLPTRPGEQVDPHGGVGFEPSQEDHENHD